MKLRTKLFITLVTLFVIFTVIIWFLVMQQTQSSNERWGAKFVQKQSVFDKYRTLLPIINEIALAEQLAHEPAIIAMALHEDDPKIRSAGLKTLEHYRTLFQDRSYFVTFSQSHNNYFGYSGNKYPKDRPSYKVSLHEPRDGWFFQTIAMREPFQINIDKDRFLGVTKVWINYVIRDNGKAVGVIGTGFDFDRFLKNLIGFKQAGGANYFIKKDLSIQLAKDARMIDYMSINKPDGTHKTIDMVITDPDDISRMKEAMHELEDSKDSNKIKTLWVDFQGEKHLLGISYTREVGWFNLTLFSENELTFVDNKNLFIVMSILLLIAMLVLGFRLKRNVVVPIEKLIEHIDRVRKGENEEDFHVSGSYEIAQLSEHFNSLVHEIQEHNTTLEQKIQERTVDLRASEMKFRSLFDFSHDAIMLLDEKGFIDCNKAALLVFGCLSVEEFCRYHPGDLSPVTQPCGTDSMTLAREHIQNALSAGYAQFEWVHQRANGGEAFFADVLLSVIEMGDKKVLQAVVRDESWRKKNEEEIEALAFYDTLTNLPNRRLLGDRLAQAQSLSKRNYCYGAVLFMDLDNFKSLNDTHGHTIGDLLLIQVAQRIRSSVRESDTVARFGGDEFIVLLSELNEDKDESIAQAALIGEKIRQTLEHPYFLKIPTDSIEEKIVEHHCTASIGLTLFFDHEQTQDEIFNQADSAMYEVKEHGRNRVLVYEKEKGK